MFESVGIRALAPGVTGGHNPAVTRLVLASRSPRRASLLRGAGLDLEVRAVDCDETPLPHEVAIGHARRVARHKLATALEDKPALAPTLTADTVVWNPTTAMPLGKPRDRAHARQVLRGLLGGDHFVTTAWALAYPARPVMLAHETTRVWMRNLDDAGIEAYLDTDEWSDKAGGYGIQGHAAGLVLRIEGSYTNVVGLPLAQVLEALRQAEANR